MIPDVARAMCSDFRAFDPTTLRVILLEGGPRILPTFPETLSEHARADLRALGVDVRTGAMVTSVDARGVRVGDEFIGARTTFWAAGNKASSLGKSLGVPLDRAGRVLVQPDLTIPGHPEVMVIGDLAALARPNGTLVPGVAPAAMQMGAHAAHNIMRRLRGEPARPFTYLNKGELATPRGSSGCYCTSCISPVSATGCPCCCSGRTCTGRTVAVCGSSRDPNTTSLRRHATGRCRPDGHDAAARRELGANGARRAAARARRVRR
jgi:NADH dehydrogenase FAD-containing subunit